MMPYMNRNKLYTKYLRLEKHVAVGSVTLTYLSASLILSSSQPLKLQRPSR